MWNEIGYTRYYYDLLGGQKKLDLKWKMIWGRHSD